MPRMRNYCCFSPPLLHGVRRRGVGYRSVSVPLFSLLSLLCDFFGAGCIFLGQAWAEGKGEHAIVRTVDGKWTLLIYLCRMRVMNKHKNAARLVWR